MMTTSTDNGNTREYNEFVDKFKPRKTTDDCMTPPNIYAVVLDWACREYGCDPSSVVRPFCPGGDYRSFDYTGKTVIDNPPFSILAEIVRFYIAWKIPFFLFAPALTNFTARGVANYVSVGCDITYDNGARVNTSFITNLGPWKLRSAPDLYRILCDIDSENRRENVTLKRKLVMPEEIVTAARLSYYSVHGVDFRVKKDDCMFVRKIGNNDIFGGGFLLSPRAAAERAAAERAAAERAAAERAAAEYLQLTHKEIELQKELGKQKE